jgi:hypothetical protein
MTTSETGTIAGLRAQLAERRMIRQRRRQLRTEIESYRTPAERLELNAIFSRATAEEIADLEAQLNF